MLTQTQADRLGRRWGMGIGCFLTIIATFVQCFAPRGNLNTFIGGRVIIGLGQGIALSTYPSSVDIFDVTKLTIV